MTKHRYPCQAPAPELLGWSNADLAVSGHHHACTHDQLDQPKHPIIEHACECGMTWTEHVQVPRTTQDAITEYLENRNKDAARENRNNKRFAISLITGFTLVGLICIGALAGQGLGWWS